MKRRQSDDQEHDFRGKRSKRNKVYVAAFSAIVAVAGILSGERIGEMKTAVCECDKTHAMCKRINIDLLNEMIRKKSETELDATSSFLYGYLAGYSDR